MVPALALLVVSVLVIGMATLRPTGAGGQYAVMAPPWYDLGETIGLTAAAGGQLVDIGGLANVVIIHADDPNIVSALYAAGAWLVLDPGHLRGCLGFARPDAGWGGV